MEKVGWCLGDGGKNGQLGYEYGPCEGDTWLGRAVERALVSRWRLGTEESKGAD